MSKEVVSILGCGWLGFPLARRLIQIGYPVKGSTTTAAKLNAFQDARITPYVFKFSPDVSGEISDFFSSDILFLDIPFRRDLLDPTFYLQQIQAVIKLVEKSTIRFVLFASSTSVYPENNVVAMEGLSFIPEDRRSRVLLEVEDLLRENKCFDTTILRFAGLYGDNRKIGGFLAGKKDIPDGDKPVNLVHLEDCINVVCEILQKNIRAETFNVCSDQHPTRRELYTLAAQRQGLPVPVFSSSSPQAYKVVSNDKIKKALNYRFLYPDPLLNI